MDMNFLRRRMFTGNSGGGGGLPSGYTQYDYIEATADSAEIDTGVVVSSDLVIQFHLYIAKANGDTFIGNKGSGDTNDFRYFTATRYEYFDLKNSRVNNSVGYPPQDVFREIGNLYIKDLSTGNIIVSGDAVEEWTIPYNVNLGYTNNMQGDKIYFVKIYDSGTLIRDFVPVYSEVDEQYGLFDMINKVFYGHDNFTGGNT